MFYLCPMNILRIQFILVFSLLFSAFVNSQNKEAEQLVQQGIKLNDEGSYQSAIRKFKEALGLDGDLPEAKYEMAYAYLQTGNSEKAVKLSKDVVRSDESLKLDAYLILGAAYEQQKNSAKSLKVYKKAAKEYPENNLAQFNLGLSYYNHRQWDEAEKCLTTAVRLNRTYPGSHFLLAHIMLKKGETVKAMLSLYYFLLLEQDSERAENAYEILENLWKSDVSTSNGKTIVSISKSKNDFYKMVNLTVRLKSVSNEENFEPEKRLEVFSENTNLLFDVLSRGYDEDIDFWELTYLDFFKELHKKGFTTPFAYYISNSTYRPQVLVWLSDHYSEFNNFINWVELYQAN